MLAGLSGLVARLHLRRLAPPSGTQYRLFNLSVLVWFLTGSVYLLGNPQRSTVQAWLTGDGQMLFANIVVILAALGTICAYRYSWAGAGLGFVVTACSLWAAFLLIGIIASFTWPGLGFMVLYIALAREAYTIAEAA